MLKTPQNLTVPLRTYRKRLIKELVHFSWEYYKNLKHFYGAQKIWGVGTTAGGGITLHHIGLRAQRFPQGQNRTLWGQGDTMAQDVLTLVYRNRMLDVFGVFVTGSAWHARDCVFSAQKLGADFK